MHSVLAYWKYRLVVLSRPFVTWVDQLPWPPFPQQRWRKHEQSPARKNSMAAFKIVHDTQDSTRAFKSLAKRQAAIAAEK
jgi:hypothetical protein